jgi:hypothetical protein
MILSRLAALAAFVAGATAQPDQNGTVFVTDVTCATTYGPNPVASVPTSSYVATINVQITTLSTVFGTTTVTPNAVTSTVYATLGVLYHPF